MGKTAEKIAYAMAFILYSAILITVGIKNAEMNLDVSVKEIARQIATCEKSLPRNQKCIGHVEMKVVNVQENR